MDGCIPESGILPYCGTAAQYLGRAGTVVKYRFRLPVPDALSSGSPYSCRPPGPKIPMFGPKEEVTGQKIEQQKCCNKRKVSYCKYTRGTKPSLLVFRSHRHPLQNIMIAHDCKPHQTIKQSSQQSSNLVCFCLGALCVLLFDAEKVHRGLAWHTRKSKSGKWQQSMILTSMTNRLPFLDSTCCTFLDGYNRFPQSYFHVSIVIIHPP